METDEGIFITELNHKSLESEIMAEWEKGVHVGLTELRFDGWRKPTSAGSLSRDALRGFADKCII